jgi:hypothetical protein
MGETHRRQGTLVPGTRFWTPEEDELLKTLPAVEVAEKTGRSLKAVHTRRQRLGMPDGRRRGRAGQGETAGPAPEDQTGRVAEDA